MCVCVCVCVFGCLCAREHVKTSAYNCLFFLLYSARAAKPNPDWAVFVARDEGTSYHVHTLYSALTEYTTCQLVRDNCLPPAVAAPAYRFPALSSGASVPRISLSATDRKQRHIHSVVRTGSRVYTLQK